MECRIFLLFLSFNTAGLSLAADLTTYCKNYKEGEVSEVKATIDASVVNGTGCLGGSLTEFYFRFRNTIDNHLVNGFTSPYDTSGTCNPTWMNNVSCQSFDSTTKIYTYVLKFTANKTEHSQQYITIETNCFPKDSNTIDYSSCDPIKFVDSTTAASTNSSGSKKVSGKSLSDDEKGAIGGSIGGSGCLCIIIVCGICLRIIIIIPKNVDDKERVRTVFQTLLKKCCKSVVFGCPCHKSVVVILIGCPCSPVKSACETMVKNVKDALCSGWTIDFSNKKQKTKLPPLPVNVSDGIPIPDSLDDKHVQLAKQFIQNVLLKDQVDITIEFPNAKTVKLTGNLEILEACAQMVWNLIDALYNGCSLNCGGGGRKRDVESGSNGVSGSDAMHVNTAERTSHTETVERPAPEHLKKTKAKVESDGSDVTETSKAKKSSHTGTAESPSKPKKEHVELSYVRETPTPDSPEDNTSGSLRRPLPLPSVGHKMHSSLNNDGLPSVERNSKIEKPALPPIQPKKDQHK